MTRYIEDIEGIGPKYGEMLRISGVRTTEQLLREGGSREGRKRLAEKSGVDEKRLLKWVNMCDLFRVKGVAGQYAELLEAAGVDTVKELRTRNAEHLISKLLEVNTEKKLVRQTPSASQVMEWVEEAKSLPAMVRY